MNLFKVSDVLNEEGVSHRTIAPTTLRMSWLIDGAARPVILFDIKTNLVTRMPDHHRMSKQNKEHLDYILNRCKFANIH